MDSATKAKYVVACDTAREAIWMRKFLAKLEVVSSIELSISLYYNNNGAITQVKESRSHQKSKHIERCFHLILEIMACGDIQM